MNEPLLPDRESQQLWQSHVLDPPMDTQAVIRSLASRIERFDRTILWRNLREYSAGLILVPVFTLMTFHARNKQEVAAGIFALLSMLWVTFWIWRAHRRQTPLDPSLDMESYRAALLARYDQQISLLKTARYWYVLPIWASTVTFAVVRGGGFSTWLVIGFAVLMTLLCVGVIWVNEVYTVGQLRRDRDALERGCFDSRDE
ncbi:MAG: hypothetical protein NZV14_18050 [Bryobacteraceae bacterium]|nr:hypothetical protein [Bryobacteraceae bacterium]MDW8380068.1 hypothetical protein [Bryobacterales bacterium]